MKNLVEPIRNAEDIKKIINYLEKLDIKYAVAFQIGIYSGLRVSDIVGLNIEDVENKTYIEVLEKKTGKYKKFPVNEKLQKIIKDFLKIRKSQWSYDEFEPLFIGKQHHRLDWTQVYRMIVKAAHECHIEGNFGTHTMRKTFGYHHYRQFKDPVLLQKIFNHSSTAITLRYIGIEQEDINNSYQQFEYDYDLKKAEQQRAYKEKKKGNFLEIQNSLDYLFNLYKKLDKKLDIMNYQEPKKNDKNIVTFLKNYINNGGIKHREFAELALAQMGGEQ